MCWSEIDPDAGTWTLPAECSKNGRRINCRCCLQMTSRRCRTSPVRLPRGSRVLGLYKCKRQLDARVGFSDSTLTIFAGR